MGNTLWDKIQRIAVFLLVLGGLVHLVMFLGATTILLIIPFGLGGWIQLLIGLSALYLVGRIFIRMA